MSAKPCPRKYLSTVLALSLCSLAGGKAEAGGLHQAASRGDLAAVNALLETESAAIDESDGMGTPLHHAVMGHYYRVVQRLISAHADLDIADQTLGTPLYLAVLLRDEAAVRLLI